MTRPTILPRDIQTAQAAGITTFVSLLEPDEAATLGLAQQADVCTRQGITFLNHPIRDMALPAHDAFQRFAEQIATRLRQGEHIALHCRASIGRSGMLTCATLAQFGYDAQTAITHVSKMRGTPIPDTPQQAAFIHDIMAGNRP